jgi:hypothetical protein
MQTCIMFLGFHKTEKVTIGYTRNIWTQDGLVERMATEEDSDVWK